jgi:DnaJ-class molecular chaperone
MSSLASTSYYTLLNIPTNASTDAIQTAYRRLALLYHPDRQNIQKNTDANKNKINIDTSNIINDNSSNQHNTDESSADQFISIQHAYKTLSDPITRSQYDQRLQQQIQLIRNTSIINEVSIYDMHFDDATEEYYHECRCGSLYRCKGVEIENLMENVKIHDDVDSRTNDEGMLVNCSGCSLSIRILME